MFSFGGTSPNASSGNTGSPLIRPASLQTSLNTQGQPQTPILPPENSAILTQNVDSFSSLSTDAKLEHLMRLMTSMVVKQDGLVNTLNTVSTDVSTMKTSLTNITSLVNTHTEEIVKLRTDLTEVQKGLNTLSQAPAHSQVPVAVTTEFTISGVPEVVQSAHHPQLITRLFDHLRIPQLRQHVIKHRVMQRNSASSVRATATPLSSTLARGNRGQTILVQMVSPQVRDAVIDAKREVGKINISQLNTGPLPADQPDVEVFVREFLHPSAYRLLQMTRSKLAGLKRGKAWVKSGVIFAKSNDVSRPIKILTEADIHRLE
uniref:Uncharacterized protein n=1 Tax=Bracon brevicornis TaxID=1563983 RepID=A0A6V7ISN7_9HYME